MKKILFIFIMLFSIIAISFSSKNITWIAIGDSITYLNDHQNETDNRVTKGYMTRVVEKLTNIDYVNKGYNGWTATAIAGNIEKLGLEKADVFSVFLGTNDWWGSKPLGTMVDYVNNTGNSTVYGAFRMIINKLHSLNKEAKIVLITPMQRVDFVYINNYKNNAWGSYKEKNGQKLEDFANAILEIGRHENLEVVDLYRNKIMDHSTLVKFKWLKDPDSGEYKKYKYPKFIGIPFDPVKDEYPYPTASIDVTYDGLHPSDKGYQIIADELINVFKKYN